MNFQSYVKELRDLKIFKDFLKVEPEAFPCSGFFIIDKEKSDNQQHFDYFVPKGKKMFSFKLEAGELAPIETIDDRVPNELDLELDFDFDEIDKIIEERKNKEGINNKTQKYLFSLQRKEGKHYLIGTVFISGLGMLKVWVDLEKKEVIEFEKHSFFDIMKVRRGKD